MRRARAAGIATALLGLLLTSCSSSPPRSGAPAEQPVRPLLSSQQAAAIVGKTSTTNNKANATFDLPLLHTYESGSAFAIDGAQYTMSKLAKKLGTKPSPSEPFTVRPLQVVVGAGRDYPASFLAVGTTSLEGPGGSTGACSHGDTLLEYEKTSADSPWRIVLEPAANEGNFARLASNGGVAAALSASELAAADAVPQRVATALQAYEVSGRLGPFSSVDFNGPCWSVPDPRKTLLQIEASGVSGRELYRPASGTVAYLIAAGAGAGTGGPGSAASTSSPAKAAKGGTLVLFNLEFEEQLFAPAGSPIKWTDQPASDPVSVLLRTGSYSTIDERGDLELAAELASDGRFSIVGEYAGVTSVKGTRAKAAGPGGTLVDAPTS